ncbi:MAG: hypothetical protein ABI345_12530 [Jatrophihabitans sp.]
MSTDKATGLLGWVGVVAITGCAALAAWLEMLLTPLYLGRVIFPVTVLLAIVSNRAFPRMAYAMAPRMLAPLLPFLAWLAVVVVFGLTGRPEGDVILSGAGAQSYVGYAMMLGGALAGTVTVVTAVPPPPPRSRERAAQPGRPTGSSR